MSRRGPITTTTVHLLCKRLCSIHGYLSIIFILFPCKNVNTAKKTFFIVRISLPLSFSVKQGMKLNLFVYVSRYSFPPYVHYLLFYFSFWYPGIGAGISFPTRGHRTRAKGERWTTVWSLSLRTLWRLISSGYGCMGRCGWKGPALTVGKNLRRLGWRPRLR